MSAVNEALTYVATIEAPSGPAETIAAALETAENPHALAVTLFECGPGLIEVSALYADEPSRDVLTRLIHGASPEAQLHAVRIEALLQKNWVAQAEGLRAAVRACRFLVHGRHDRGKVPASRYTLEIDAGLAFGTAHHATTRGCLMALDRISKREHPCRVVDIGTGTGILAIAAAKALGGPVIASDMDPVAVGVAAGNVRINGVRSRVRVVEAKGLAHPALRGAKADLLFANILLRPLLSLAPSFAGAIRPGGICLLSGILDSQAPTVEARFRNFGFRLESRILLDGWTVLLLRRGSTKPVRAD
jgi:ribosomal protein L11 methyltransferase